MKNTTLTAMKNSIHVIIYMLLILLLAVNSLKAQNSGQQNLGNEDVTIVKEYQPVLNDAFKINILPEGDTSVAEPLHLQYNLEPQQMNSVYTLSPIKPVKIKDDVIKKLYRGFAKAGYGNYNTPLVEVSYHSLRSKIFDAGVDAKHMSSTGDIKGFGHPNFSENKLGLNGTRYFDKNAVRGALNFSRNVYHFYGYHQPPEMFTKTETKHLMNDLSGDFGFYSTTTDKDKLAYSAGIKFNSFSDNRESSESTVRFNAGGGKRYNDSYISGEIELDATGVKQPLQDNNRTVFRIMPRYAFKKDKYFITAGANIGYESGDAIDSKIHFYPHLETKFQLLTEEVSVYGQLSGNIRTTTLSEFSKENQFLNDLVPLVNTNTKLDLSAGVNVKLSKELMTVAGITFQKIAKQPYYISLYNSNEPIKYTIFYDEINMMNLHVEMNYLQEHKTSFGIRADYYAYNNDSLKKPLYKPVFRLGLNGNYNIADKIYIKADLFYNALVYAYEYSTTNPIYIKLKDYMDINIGVDYKYSKVLTAFVQVNNIGMQRYFRWFNYPSYRLNAMAGVTYSFW